MIFRSSTLTQLQNKNEKAFEEIYQKYHKLVFYVALQIVKDEDVAQDIMQDTFVKFMKQIDHYEDQGKIKQYLTTISKNLSLNYIKKNRRNEVDYEITNDDFVFKDDIDIDKEILFTRLSYLLNDKELNIVILYVLEDKKHREIAQLLDLPLGTVTYIYSRAIEKLKKGLIDFHE